MLADGAMAVLFVTLFQADIASDCLRSGDLLTERHVRVPPTVLFVRYSEQKILLILLVSEQNWLLNPLYIYQPWLSVKYWVFSRIQMLSQS